MDRVDDSACETELDAFPGAEATTTPTSIHEPHSSSVRFYLCRKKLGVLARVPNQERPTKHGENVAVGSLIGELGILLVSVPGSSS